MKKSEKIEVRLSFEEKEALSDLAKQEGKSVSGLIRDLIEKYMSLNAARPIKTSAWGKLAAVAVIGALVGHLGTYAFVQNHNVAHAQETPEFHSVGVNIDDFNLRVPILAQNGAMHDFTLTTKTNVMKLKLAVTEENKALKRLSVNICAQTDTTCEPVANPSFLLHPTENAHIESSGANGEKIFIISYPPPKPKSISTAKS